MAESKGKLEGAFRKRLRPMLDDGNFLDRYGQLEHVVQPEGPSDICFIHNHRVLRATKIYINIYHLWPKWLNGALFACGLGGGFHSAIEVFDTEYQYRGCSDDDQGIFETQPAYKLKERLLQDPDDCSESEREMASQIGDLKERRVVGLWSGSKSDFDLMICHLKDLNGWKGCNYKMLTFNCNHFVADVCACLMENIPHFHAAKGMNSLKHVVPRKLFRLSDMVKAVCCRSVTRGLDEDVIPAPSGKVFAFRGKAYKLGVASSSSAKPPHRERVRTMTHHSRASASTNHRTTTSGGSSRIASSITSGSGATSSIVPHIKDHRPARGRGRLPRTAGGRLMPQTVLSGSRDTSDFSFGEIEAVNPASSPLRYEVGKRRRVVQESVPEDRPVGSQPYCADLIVEEIVGRASTGQLPDPVVTGKKKTTKSPTRISPRAEPAFHRGPTRLLAYKSIDDVRWLDEMSRDESSNGRETTRSPSSRSTMSSSRPASLGIGVELRAKPSTECTPSTLRSSTFPDRLEDATLPIHPRHVTTGSSSDQLDTPLQGNQLQGTHGGLSELDSLTGTGTDSVNVRSSSSGNEMSGKSTMATSSTLGTCDSSPRLGAREIAKVAPTTVTMRGNPTFDVGTPSPNSGVNETWVAQFTYSVPRPGGAGEGARKDEGVTTMEPQQELRRFGDPPLWRW